MFDASWTTGAGDVTQGFVVRVASSNPLYIGADIRVHHDMYAALADVDGVPVPRVYGYEDDASLLGAPFFVMERIRGLVPGDQPAWPTARVRLRCRPRRASGDVGQRRCRTGRAARRRRVDASSSSLRRPAPAGSADHLAYWRRWLDDPSSGATHDTIEAGYEWLLDHLPEPAADRAVVGRLPLRQHHVRRHRGRGDLRLGHGVVGRARRRPRLVAVHGRPGELPCPGSEAPTSSWRGGKTSPAEWRPTSSSTTCSRRSG